jgi:hypothetical protein
VLALWVLAANVVADFPRTRVKLVTTPLAAARRVTLPLTAASRIPGEQLVLVYVVRNAGGAPVTITPRIGDRVLRATTVQAGASARVDLAWPRPRSPEAPDVIELTGTTDAWTLAYAELANLHGFTRGVFEFLVLPAAQPFTAPPPWGLLLLAACSVLAGAVRRNPWPPWAGAVQGALMLVFVAFLLLIVLSPWLSPYRIVLSTHTFALAIGMIWLRQILDAMVSALRWSSDRLARARPQSLARWGMLVLVIATIGYTLLLSIHMGAYAGAADSSGYMNSARLLAERRVSTPIRRVPGVPESMLPEAAYAPLGFKPRGAGEIVPTYPIGLPLLVATAAPAWGWVRAPAVAMLLHALLGVLLTGLLARACGLPRRAAVLAAILLATSPIYLFMSVQLMSDTPALAWTTMAVVLCCGGERATRRTAKDLFVGVAVSIAILVRPTNILILLPVALCLGLAWRRWLCVAAGAVPGGLLLAGYNVEAYGHAITTGYGNMSRLFSLQNVLPSLRNYVTWLPVVLTPIGLLALGLPVVVRRGRRMAAVLIVWAASFTLFYAFYYYTHLWWWYLRFILPAFPPLIVGALWVGARAWNRWCAGPLGNYASPIAFAVLTTVVIAHNAFWTDRLAALNTGQDERVYVDAAALVTGKVPATAVVLTMQVSGAFFYYTAFPVIRWDRCDRATLERLEAQLLDAGTPLYAVFFPFEIEDQRAFDRLPGMWTRIARVRHVTIWQLMATDEQLSTSPIVGSRLSSRTARPQ